jgi:hypothetical protein
MGIQGLVNIKKAISSLNPDQVRQLAAHEARIALVADNAEAFERMERFLLRDLSPDRARQSSRLLARQPNPPAGAYDLTLYDEETIAPPNSFVFRGANPEQVVEQVLDSVGDMGVSLARSFQPFRRPFIERAIARTCKENTLFSLATALPDVIPSIIELPWAIAEFASDTAFLTMNQLRMAFFIAAASDRPVGYREQKSEIATVIASAFGWRALARQAVGKIPFGGGLIGKAAVAYAGTRVVGLSLDRLYAIGYNYTREERERLYADALQKGKDAAGRLLSHLRPDLAARFVAKKSARQASGNGAA